ncbi:MAG: hypothetical protein AAFR71_11410 [Pseudomonadota bacterium]
MSEFDAYLEKASFVEAVKDLRENPPPNLQIPAEQLPDVSDNTGASGNAARDQLFEKAIFEAATDYETGERYQLSQNGAESALGDKLVDAYDKSEGLTSFDGEALRTDKDTANALKQMNDLGSQIDPEETEISIEISDENGPLENEQKKQLLETAVELTEDGVLDELLDQKAAAYRQHIIESPQPDFEVARINQEMDNNIALNQMVAEGDMRGVTVNLNMGDTVASTLADDDASIESIQSHASEHTQYHDAEQDLSFDGRDDRSRDGGLGL